MYSTSYSGNGCYLSSKVWNGFAMSLSDSAHTYQASRLLIVYYTCCPVLSIQQLYRISTMYWDDKYGTQSVTSEV
ncbi:hypothetical protein ZIOFF_044775 [Zingiber officinale]|uniref:Uncharacterized protein n=1 Tax=Zingiber officinale TaxID=94328 RepID=A0A8J5KUQ6_ZINOF|nr:hypothetical protein ZIOFF_044775 [Zingiber officinale]